MAESTSGIIGLDNNAGVENTYRDNDVFFETDRVVHFGKADGEADQAFGRIFFDSAAALFKIESTKDGTGVTKPMAFLIEGTQAARITAGRAFLVGTVTTVLSTEKLRVDGAIAITDGGSAQYIESTNASSAAFSAAATGRLRYDNAGSGNWQVSVQGGPYANVVTAANAFVQDGNSFGALATLGTNDGFALAFETVGVERGRFLTTGEFLVGTTVLAGSEFVLFEKDQNQNTFLQVRNNTNGTLARATAVVGVGGGNNINVMRTSALFTPTAGILANEAAVVSESGTLAIITPDANPIRFTTNAVERARFLSTGAFLIGSTVTTGATQLLLVKKNQDTDTLATVENVNVSVNASCAFQAKTGTSRVISMRAFPGVGANANVAHFISNGMNTMRWEMFGAGSLVRFFQWREGATGEELMDLNRVSGLRVKQLVNTAGTPNAIVVTGAAHTGLANVEVISANFNFAQTVTFTGGGGVIAENRTVVFQATTYSSPLAQTITDASTVKITGPPVAAGSLTITNAFALDVTGNSIFRNKLTVVGVIDPTAVLLSGSAKKIGATDAGPIFIAPFADSTAAFQIREADDTEVVFNVDTVNGRIGIENATGAGPQYRLDIGNLSYFAINGNFAHIVQHNSAASTFWSIAPRNSGDLDIAVTTTDPRPTSGTIGTSDNAISIKTNKDVDFLGSVTALNLKAHALIENRNPVASTTSGTFVTLASSAATTFSGRPVLCFVNVSLFPTAINTGVEFAIQIDAGADAVASQILLNEAEHTPVPGAVIVTPTAGSHTIRLRWRRTGGAGTLTLDANDQILLHAVEL